MVDIFIFLSKIIFTYKIFLFIATEIQIADDEIRRELLSYL